jgi:plastocyanin
VPPAIGVTITTAPGDTLAFEPAETSIEVVGPIAVTFRNGSSLPHNLTFGAGLIAATRTIVEPGTSDQLLVAPPASGTYRFVCTIHDGMAGTLVVRAAGAASDQSATSVARDR